jgi:hypothetical protein
LYYFQNFSFHFHQNLSPLILLTFFYPQSFLILTFLVNLLFQFHLIYILHHYLYCHFLLLFNLIMFRKFTDRFHHLIRSFFLLE